MFRITACATSLILGWIVCALGTEVDLNELLSGKGPALAEAVRNLTPEEEESLSTGDRIALAERLAAETHGPSAIGGESSHTLYHLFQSACERPSSEELDRLVALYATFEPNSFDKSALFEPLAAAWMAREIDARQEWNLPELPQTEKPIPAKLVDAPPELRDAWQWYARAMVAFDRNFDREEPPGTISFQANERSFYRLLDEILSQKSENAAERLLAFEWTGTCGTGSSSLGIPQSIALFMVLLQEGRLAEAVGAVLQMGGSTVPVGVSDAKSIRIIFLQKCGLDWERLMVGAALRWDFLSGDSPLLRELAGFGSERTALLLLQEAARAEPSDRETYARVLTAFLPEGVGGYNSQNLSRLAPLDLSDMTQGRIVEQLQSFALPDARAEVLQAVLSGMSRHPLPSMKPTLRALLRHTDSEVAETAAELLRKLGEDATASPDAPVRFRVLVNGAPLPAGTEIGWEVKDARMAFISSSAKIDEAGIVALPLQYFQKRKPTTVAFSRRSPDHLALPLFEVELPIPQHLESVTEAHVEVWPVDLTVNGPNPPADGETIKVEINPHLEKVDDDAAYFRSTFPKYQLSFPSGRAHRLLMTAGAYDLQVSMDGARRASATLEVGPKTPSFGLTLEGGGSVHFQIMRPDGEREAHFELLKNGRVLEDPDLDYSTSTYRGLAVGDYVLRIAGTTTAASRQVFPYAPRIPYFGRDVPFRIDSARTDTLNLGEIRLEAAPH